MTLYQENGNILLQFIRVRRPPMHSPDHGVQTKHTTLPVCGRAALLSVQTVPSSIPATKKNTKSNAMKKIIILYRNYSRFRQFSERFFGKTIICVQKPSVQSYTYPFTVRTTVFESLKKKCPRTILQLNKGSILLTDFKIEDVTSKW